MLSSGFSLLQWCGWQLASCWGSCCKQRLNKVKLQVETTSGYIHLNKVRLKYSESESEVKGIHRRAHLRVETTSEVNTRFKPYKYRDQRNTAVHISTAVSNHKSRTMRDRNHRIIIGRRSREQCGLNSGLIEVVNQLIQHFNVDL